MIYEHKLFEIQNKFIYKKIPRTSWDTVTPTRIELVIPP